MDKRPPPQATPSGVKVRHLVSGDRLQIAFTWEGQECRELLPACAINKSSIQRAASLRDEIRRKIAEGSFSYADYFPDSARAASPSKSNPLMETLLQKRVDGLLLMCTENHRPSKDAISRYPSLPIVMMDWSPFDGANDVIQDNALLGGEMATEYLIRQGYRKIACITGPLDKTTAQERLNGYRQAMNKAGLVIPPGYEVSGDFEFEGGVPAMEKLLSLPEPPHAVFAGNDAMAVGAYQALYQRGLRVPDDVAVIGYDDIQLAQYMMPPLTTIHQPKDSLGELAVDALLHRLQDPQAEPQILVLTPELVVRQSVGSFVAK